MSKKNITADMPFIEETETSAVETSPIDLSLEDGAKLMGVGVDTLAYIIERGDYEGVRDADGVIVGVIIP